MPEDMVMESESGLGQASSEESQQGFGQAETGNESNQQAANSIPAGYVPEKDYKSLQAEFGRRNEAMKALNDQMSKYGGVESVLKNAELANDPQIQQYLRQKSDPYANADDETRRVAAVIREIAAPVAAKEAEERFKNLQQEIQRNITPHIERARQIEYQAQIDAFEKEVGPEWKDVEKTMIEMAQYLPRTEGLPPVEALKLLHMAALQKEGKLEAYQAKQYQKTISQKKNQSQGRGGGTGAGESGGRTYKSLADSFESALRQHGMAGI